MDERLFWQLLANLGGLQQLWWYNSAVTPALLVAILGLVMMTLAVREHGRKTIVFAFLLLACIPLILISPSFYAALRPRAALGLAGLDWPAAPNQFSRPVAQTLSDYLAVMAQLGMSGAVLALLIVIGSLMTIASTTHVPILSTAAREITQRARDMTKRLRRSPAVGQSSSPLDRAHCLHGRLEVLTGAHKGNHFAIRPGDTLGRRECDIALSDSIVSSRHARFELDPHQQTAIIDEKSTNGLFVYRDDGSGSEHKYDLTLLRGEPFTLQSGDMVVLGDPDHKEDGQYAVKLRFEHDFS